MSRYDRTGEMDRDIFVGIDIHNRMWHVTITNAANRIFWTAVFTAISF